MISNFLDNFVRFNPKNINKWTENSQKIAQFWKIYSLVQFCFESNKLGQRILEHLEWKLLGDFSKSKTTGDSKEAL